MSFLEVKSGFTKGIAIADLLFLALALLQSCNADSSFKSTNESAPTRITQRDSATKNQSEPTTQSFPEDEEVEDDDDDDDIEPAASGPRAQKPITESAPKSLEEVEALCNEKSIQTSEQVIDFPAATNGCAWGMNGNLPLPSAQMNLIFSARHEQKVELAFPRGAVLCDLHFNFAAQTIVYDDEIIISLNNHILASSQDYQNDFLKNGNFLLYDWNRLVGKPYAIDKRKLYCVGADINKGTCVIPQTQQRGTMVIKLDSSVVKEMGIAAGINEFNPKPPQTASSSKASINLITLGDNDDALDCRHSGFKFGVTYKYVIPK